MSDLMTGRDEETDGRGNGPPPLTARTYSRRVLLRAALGAAGAATLAACGGEGPAATPAAGTTPASGGGSNPTAAARPAATTTAARTATTTAATTRAGMATAASSPVALDGKIPSPMPGVPDAYTKYPPLYQSVAGKPGRGGTVTAFNATYQAPVPARGENRFWQELEKRLGVTLEMTQVPSAGYTEKLAALTASGDLADITFLIGPSADQLKVIQQGAYTDLTPYLTGDALKDYPNLALFAPKLWTNARIRGKLYGVPRQVYLTGGPLVFRQDWAAKAGPAQPRNADEAFRALQSFAGGDPDGNGRPDTFGLAGGDFVLGWLQQMFRAPNGWRKNGDGSLTNIIETEEFKQALTFARRLFEVGAYHPDTATMGNAQLTDAFAGGKVGAITAGLPDLPGSAKGLRFRTRQVTPTAEVIGLVPPGHDGGAGVTYNTSGYFGLAAIPAKAGRDKERVRELLRILDYYAAPFGSEEWTFLNYGLEGVHHEVKPDATRELGDLGKKELGDLWSLMTGERVFFYDVPGDAEYMQRLVRDLLAIGIDNPTLGLYSATGVAKGAELGQLRTDRLTAMVTGREPLSALDGWIKEWRSRGGDQIRKEYEQELKA
jgi:putative aldouronate transport system substrate-binding protein